MDEARINPRTGQRYRPETYLMTALSIGGTNLISAAGAIRVHCVHGDAVPGSFTMEEVRRAVADINVALAAYDRATGKPECAEAGQ